MALIRWQPRESRGIQREIDTLVNKFWGDPHTWHGTGWHPSVDVAESENAFTVYAELPGLNKEDIKVTLEDNMLTIEGERKRTAEKENAQVHRSERFYGTFKRAFTLSSEIDSDKVSADYKDGILTLTLPKSEAAKPRQIDVAVS